MGTESLRPNGMRTAFEAEGTLLDRLARKRALHDAFSDNVWILSKVHEAIGEAEEDDVCSVIESYGRLLSDDIAQFSPQTSDHLFYSAYRAEKDAVDRRNRRAVNFLKMLIHASAVLTPKEFSEVTRYRERLQDRISSFLLSHHKEISDYFFGLLTDVRALDAEYTAAQHAVNENASDEIPVRETPKPNEKILSTEELRDRLTLLLLESPVRIPQLRKILTQLHAKGEAGDALMLSELQKRLPTIFQTSIAEILSLFLEIKGDLNSEEQAFVDFWQEKETRQREYAARVAFDQSPAGERFRELRYQFSDAFNGSASLDPSSLPELFLALRSANEKASVQKLLQNQLNTLHHTITNTLVRNNHRDTRSLLSSLQHRLASIDVLRGYFTPEERVAAEHLETFIREQIPLLEARLTTLPQSLDELEEDLERALDSSLPDAKDRLRAAILALHRGGHDEELCATLQQRIDWVRPEFQQLLDEYPGEVEEWIAQKKRLLPLLLVSDDILTPREDELFLKYYNTLRAKIAEWEKTQITVSEHAAHVAKPSSEAPSPRERCIARLAAGEFAFVRPILENTFGKRWFDDVELKRAAQEGIEKQWNVAQERNPKLLPTLERFIDDFELETPKIKKAKKKASRT